MELVPDLDGFIQDVEFHQVFSETPKMSQGDWRDLWSCHLPLSHGLARTCIDNGEKGAGKC